MWRLKRARLLSVPVEIAGEVYDEILRDVRAHPSVEVGGKFVGVFSSSDGLKIRVLHHLDAGPGARRTPTSHHPDPAYQVALFRHLEAEFPEVEHLGSWHSHHPNGLPRLSSGDIEHYFTAVNRPDHNHDLFLASLVVDGRGLAAARHFLFVRGHDRYFELDPGLVTRAATSSPYDGRMADGRKRLSARKALTDLPTGAHDDG